MEKIVASPWHLCRQHLFLIAKKVKEKGIRAVAREVKEVHSVVARFARTPEAVSIQTIYKIANEVGMIFRLEIQPNLQNTEKSKINPTAPPKRKAPANPTPTRRRRNADTSPAKR